METGICKSKIIELRIQESEFRILIMKDYRLKLHVLSPYGMTEGRFLFAIEGG